MGGGVARMTRIWPGEVCVRSTQWRSGAGDIERVPQVARRVVGGNVERLEVELVGLDLGRLVGHEAELAEDARDLALRLDERMERAARAACGPGSVTSLRSRAKRTSRAISSSRARRSAICRLELLAHRVGQAHRPWADPARVAGRWRRTACAARRCVPGRNSRRRRARPGRRPWLPLPSARHASSASWAEKDSRSTAVRRYLARATSAMLANVAASRTAMSARILRSSATPAVLRPLISFA